MAAVRCAARRLGGSLIQRTQAAVTSPAVAEERRRLFLPRLVHTRRNAPESPESIREAMRAIQEQKEDLYDLISLTETASRGESENRELLKSLSVQIEPRPDDPQWCSMRALKRAAAFMNIASTFCGFLLGGFCFALLYEPAEEMEGSKAVNKKKQEFNAAEEKWTVNKKRQEMDAAEEKEVAHV